MSQHHSRKKSANIPRPSQRSSSKNKDGPNAQSYSIFQNSTKKLKEGSGRKEKDLAKSLYQTRSMEKLHDTHRSGIEEVTRKEIQKEKKIDSSKKVALKLAAIKKLVNANALSQRLLQNTEEIEKTESLIQKEKSLLLKEYKNLNQTLRKLQDGDLDKSKRENFDRKTVQDEVETNREFRHEILNKIEKLNNRYSTLEKSLLQPQKPSTDEIPEKAPRKRKSESHSHVPVVAQTSREREKEADESGAIYTERLRSRGSISGQLDARRSSKDNTQAKDREKSRIHEDFSEKEMKIRENLKTATEILEAREKDLKRREEKLEKRILEFMKEKEEFEEYKKEIEEKLRREQLGINEQKEFLDRIERENFERKRMLEQSEKDFERLTQELEDRSDELMQRKEEHERDLEVFFRKAERFEKEKEEFTMFEKEFHEKNLEFKAEKEKVKELSAKVMRESRELEEKYEEYYKKYAELEAKYQAVHRKEEDIFEKEKMMVDDQLNKIKEIKDMHRRKEDSSKKMLDIGETRLKAKQEDSYKREKVSSGVKDRDHVKSSGMKLEEKQKKREKCYDSFTGDSSKDYEEQVRSIGKGKEGKSNKKRPARKNDENEAPEEVTADRIVVPDNSWNDKSLMPLSSRTFNLDTFES